MDYSQLPPHMRTRGLSVADLSSPRQSFDHSASQAVSVARGTVAAASSGIPLGILKQIFSSAIVYWAYPPRP